MTERKNIIDFYMRGQPAYPLPYDMAKQVARDLEAKKEVGPQTLQEFALAYQELAFLWEESCKKK